MISNLLALATYHDAHLNTGLRTLTKERSGGVVWGVTQLKTLSPPAFHLTRMLLSVHAICHSRQYILYK